MAGKVLRDHASLKCDKIWLKSDKFHCNIVVALAFRLVCDNQLFKSLDFAF